MNIPLKTNKCNRNYNHHEIPETECKTSSAAPSDEVLELEELKVRGKSLLSFEKRSLLHSSRVSVRSNYRNIEREVMLPPIVIFMCFSWCLPRQWQVGSSCSCLNSDLALFLLEFYHPECRLFNTPDCRPVSAPVDISRGGYFAHVRWLNGSGNISFGFHQPECKRKIFENWDYMVFKQNRQSNTLFKTW